MANILIVDDEPNILKLTSFLLKGLGHQVHTANSGKTALDYLKNTPAIDLILSDLIMPEMTGFELCAEIGDRYPVVIISAMCRELKPETPFTVKAIDYISKPFDIDQLKKRIPLYLHKYKKTTGYTPEIIQLDNISVYKGENVLIYKKDIRPEALPGPVLLIENEEALDQENIIAHSEQLGQNIQTKAGGSRFFTNINFEKHLELIKRINHTNLALGDITGIFLTKNPPSDIIRLLFDRCLE